VQPEQPDPIDPGPDWAGDFLATVKDDLQELIDPAGWAVVLTAAACVWAACWVLNALGFPM